MYKRQALNLETSDLLRSFVALPAALFIAGLIASYCFLFKANFPDIDGGKGSVVFFAEIRARSEAGYREAFLEASADEYRDDLIGQIWRNSEILCAKYEGVRKAIYATTATLAPFLVLLTATAALHGRVPLLNG